MVDDSIGFLINLIILFGAHYVNFRFSAQRSRQVTPVAWTKSGWRCHTAAPGRIATHTVTRPFILQRNMGLVDGLEGSRAARQIAMGRDRLGGGRARPRRPSMERKSMPLMPSFRQPLGPDE
jgi:hypothetical protein